MLTFVGILTFISIINTRSERLKARKVLIFQYFRFLWAVGISCSVELSMKTAYNLGARIWRSIIRDSAWLIFTPDILPEQPQSYSNIWKFANYLVGHIWMTCHNGNRENIYLHKLRLSSWSPDNVLFYESRVDPDQLASDTVFHLKKKMFLTNFPTWHSLPFSIFCW